METNKDRIEDIMKEKYEELMMEVITFEMEDVIVTSTEPDELPSMPG